MLTLQRYYVSPLGAMMPNIVTLPPLALFISAILTPVFLALEWRYTQQSGGYVRLGIPYRLAFVRLSVLLYVVLERFYVVTVMTTLSVNRAYALPTPCKGLTNGDVSL